MIQPQISNTSEHQAAFQARLLSGISERVEHGVVVLSPQNRPARRRVVFVNSYGGASGWQRIKAGTLAPHHLWGCIELVRLGYEVALAEPLKHFYLYRRPLPHDLGLLPLVRDWLGRDGILFCGHTLLYWLPILRRIGVLQCKVVSLTYAREELDFSGFHDGIVALTPAAASHAAKIARRVKVAHVGWGVDLDFYPKLEYEPEWFLSCGIANRDFETLHAAASLTPHPLRVISPGLSSGLRWPSHATVIDGGSGWHTDQNKVIEIHDLIAEHYSRSFASLVIMKPDPGEYTANGFTNVMESMALGRPVIVTRTGALPGELDVEAAGCGLHVPPQDPMALAKAFATIAADPQRAREMGEQGRRLCERRYNLTRCAADLHRFFESL
jgi:hypothetical protein